MLLVIALICVAISASIALIWVSIVLNSAAIRPEIVSSFALVVASCVFV